MFTLEGNSGCSSGGCNGSKPVLNQDNESGSVSVSMKVSATDSQNVTAGFILKTEKKIY